METAIGSFILGGPELHICLRGEDRCAITHSPELQAWQSSAPHVGVLTPAPHR